MCKIFCVAIYPFHTDNLQKKIVIVLYHMAYTHFEHFPAAFCLLLFFCFWLKCFSISFHCLRTHISSVLVLFTAKNKYMPRKTVFVLIFEICESIMLKYAWQNKTKVSVRVYDKSGRGKAIRHFCEIVPVRLLNDFEWHWHDRHTYIRDDVSVSTPRCFISIKRMTASIYLQYFGLLPASYAT